MTFGSESDEQVAHRQLDRFLDQGGNFVDTADVYSDGESEKIIGRWLAARPGTRDRVVVATKGRFAKESGPNDVGLSRVSLTRALEASLRRLGVEVIDLYQAHAWDPLTPIEETLRFFDDAVRVGKIQYVGVSNFIGWQLQKTALLTRHLGLAPIVTLQPQYNLLQRGVEFELSQVCVNEHSGILPWSPLGAAGCRASTSATAHRSGRPVWARTPSVAWRRMRGATPRSGGSSTPSGRLPRRGACRWPGWPWAGWSTARP
jgi:aryl-alcohol dehydrogenase-like predicted oxidoreductase